MVRGKGDPGRSWAVGAPMCPGKVEGPHTLTIVRCLARITDWRWFRASDAETRHVPRFTPASRLATSPQSPDQFSQAPTGMLILFFSDGNVYTRKQKVQNAGRFRTPETILNDTKPYCPEPKIKIYMPLEAIFFYFWKLLSSRAGC